MNTVDRKVFPLHQVIPMILETVELRKSNTYYGIPYLVSEPGSGKTMMLQQEVKKRGWGLLTYQLGLERIEKFSGIPDMKWETVSVSPKINEYYKDINKVNEVLNTSFKTLAELATLDNPQKEKLTEYYNKYIRYSQTKNELHTIWSIPEIICEIRKNAEEHEMTVVFFDDWHLCDEEIQSVGHELFDMKRSINGYKIPDNVIFVLAGNETSACGAKVQMASIRNRTMLFYVENSVEYWLENFAYPNFLLEAGIAFFEQKSNWDVFHEKESTTSQFGSPRAWTSLFNYLKVIEPHYPNKTIDRNTVTFIAQSAVSQVATSRFSTFYLTYKTMDMVNLFDKGVIEIPNNSIDAYTYSTVVTTEFYNRFHNNKQKEKSCKTYVDVLQKLVDVNRKELAISSCYELIRRKELKEFNLMSGTEIFKYLYNNSYISTNLSNALKEVVKVITNQ